MGSMKLDDLVKVIAVLQTSLIFTNDQGKIGPNSGVGFRGIATAGTVGLVFQPQNSILSVEADVSVENVTVKTPVKSDRQLAEDSGKSTSSTGITTILSGKITL